MIKSCKLGEVFCIKLRPCISCGGVDFVYILIPKIKDIIVYNFLI